MKVLNLQCSYEHVFEGWFSSEDDYLVQKESGHLLCPLCGDSTITKRLSAPRLNFGRSGAQTALVSDANSLNAVDPILQLQSAWSEFGRRVVANTEDVGDGFSLEARKIHYGEVPERGIRGRASKAEVESLRDEGIGVVPLVLPDSAKQTLQ